MIKSIKKLILGEKNNKYIFNKNEKPDAIILAAGMLGRKNLYPKALIEYGGKPIIEHQINWLKPFVNKIIIACHKKECEQISNIVGHYEGIEFSTETRLLGTAGATKKAAEKSKADSVIIVNVDDITDIDLNALINFGTDTICVSNPRVNFGIIETEGFDIKQFREKPILKNIWASCGVYYLSKKTISKMPDYGTLEQDVWPYINIRAFKHFGTWKTFNRN
ncbi:MAG: sugar phosphate nucleotidyltransferase [Candidatus Pacearchaeota archaeon]|nr:sugar phosphate nucleotidyltransferase [Candidatus Pacearchaeota archaeon]